MRPCIAAVVVVFITLSIPVARAGDQSAEVQKTLERLAGRWIWTGQQANIGAENSPYGQAGRFIGSGEARLIMDGQFILDEYQEKSPEGNVMHGVSLVSYDPVKKCFVARDCMSDGSTSVMESTFEGRVRKDRITITSKTGEILLARVVGEYSRDWKRLEVTWEGSTDNGASWKHWCTAVVEKTGEADNDEQELIRLQQEWCRAELAGDVRGLDRLLADEYVLTLSDGTALPKAEYVSDVQSEDTRSTALTVENTKVRLYGDMALVEGIVKWTEPSGKKHEDLFHETWLKRDGRWQCLATHESGQPEVVEAAKLSPAMKKLAVMAGQWSYEGEQAAPPVVGLPYGGAGKFSGTVTARFVLDGHFLEEIVDDQNPGGTTRSVGMTGYDPQTKKYVANGFTSEGSRDRSVQTVSDDGLTWTSRSTTTTEDGKDVPMRSVFTYAPDGNSYTGTTEASPDNGQTWKLWFRERGKRQSK